MATSMTSATFSSEGAGHPEVPAVRSLRRNGRTSTNSANNISLGNFSNTSTTPSRLRVYKSNSTNKWVTREIAALEFLLGIPMQSERNIVHQGWLQQQGHSKQTNETGAFGHRDETKTELLEPPDGVDSQQNSTTPTSSHHGRWWEKWVNNPSASRSAADLSRRSAAEEDELEQPEEVDKKVPVLPNEQTSRPALVPVVHAPGRRLEGDEAVKVQIPLTGDTSVITRQRFVARMAFTREWELKVAHGIGGDSNSVGHEKDKSRKGMSPDRMHPPLLDGRLFFSAAGSYPHQVFSLLRYEPKKEEAARMRQKLEARGGGGTQFFIMPVRDWRGISYRALLPPRVHSSIVKTNDGSAILFDRFASSRATGEAGNREEPFLDENHPDVDGSIASDEDTDGTDEEGADTYVAGLLDDPEMVQGRHRTVMIGDRVTGCIVSSTIQFVKPELLKADLNKQFRERFDGWEPPKSQRKYIGARVIDGLYTLLDPSTLVSDDVKVGGNDGDPLQQAIVATPRNRQVSPAAASASNDAAETIRMPPSLTLSKIRSVKRQALLAAVKAKLEISTVALAIVYFERLCLDCRVDKTNRRLSFAACLLLAIKINEAHVGLVIRKQETVSSKTSTTSRIQSLIRPTKKSSTMFATLLEFFTQDWNISLKHLFAAEWGVFAALQFRLHAKPSQVAFHFKRLLKSLDWNPRRYLGAEMYDYWQGALAHEEYLRQGREARREMAKQKKEQKKLMRLQRELDAANRREENDNVGHVNADIDISEVVDTNESGRHEGLHQDFDKIFAAHSDACAGNSPTRRTHRQGSRIGGILNRFSGVKRAASSDKLVQVNTGATQNDTSASRLTMSPSMPVIAPHTDHTEIPDSGVIDMDHIRLSQSDCEASVQSYDEAIIV